MARLSPPMWPEAEGCSGWLLSGSKQYDCPATNSSNWLSGGNASRGSNNVDGKCNNNDGSGDDDACGSNSGDSSNGRDSGYNGDDIGDDDHVVSVMLVAMLCW